MTPLPYSNDFFTILPNGPFTLLVVGVWTNIFTLIAGISVITNSALITNLKSYGLNVAGFWLFTLMQWVGFLLMFIIIKVNGMG